MELSDGQAVEFLGLLKDFASVMKQDATQVRAKIDRAPKIEDDQANIPLIGGKSPNGAPGGNIAKQIPPLPVGAEDSSNGVNAEELSGKESSMLKAEDSPKSLKDLVEDEPKSEEGASVESPTDEAPQMPEGHPEGCFCEACKKAREAKSDEGANMGTVKSLFKDIRKALEENVAMRKQIDMMQKSMQANIKKSVNAGVEVQMRKLGYGKTQPPIRKLELGADQTLYGDLKKSQDDLEASRGGANQAEMLMTDLSKKSFEEIANLRLKTGDLGSFKAWLPNASMYPDKK